MPIKAVATQLREGVPAGNMERRATWTPMKRNVTEQDVAETIFSLITSNPFVTGETIVIDGGYAATS